MSGNAIEERRVSVEEQRLALDQEKERREKRHSFYTRLGVVAPLAVALIAAAVSLYTNQRAERNDFELKAAEIAFDSDSPVGTANRSRALAALFPDRLPDDFAARFEPEEYEGGSGIAEAKKELLRLILEHPKDRRRILRVWRELFPGDDWIDAVEPLAR